MTTTAVNEELVTEALELVATLGKQRVELEATFVEAVMVAHKAGASIRAVGRAANINHETARTIIRKNA